MTAGATSGLVLEMVSESEREIVAVVTRFVDQEVRPRVSQLEHADEYPEELIETMKRIGIFGLVVPEEYGGVAASTACLALVTEQLARGWMSLAGAIGGHSVVVNLISSFGTPEQKRRLLPRMATGELRATMALTEPDGGSDLQAMRTVARRDAGDYVLDGTKMWISNAQHSGLAAVLCKTDPGAEPAHRGMSILLAEKGPGFVVSRRLGKLGYKGVETCEVVFQGLRLPPGALLGGVEGQGFAQMMRGLEVGRVQVAARALGVARAALEDSLAYAQERHAFGKPIWQHQSIGNYLADSATRLHAARLLTMDAARRIDHGERGDLEAGMAKLFASETCLQITTDALRIHGGNGYSTEYAIERYYRDAPLMVVGEGTNEIQRNVIAAQLVRRGRLPS